MMKAHVLTTLFCAAVIALDLRGPPTLQVPMDRLEPNRAVPASKWNSFYCARWSDGCSECKRTLQNEKIRCSDDAAACSRHANICQDILDEPPFWTICKEYSNDTLYKGKEGTIYAFPEYHVNTWTLKESTWEHGDMIPGNGFNRAGRVAIKAFGYDANDRSSEALGAMERLPRGEDHGVRCSKGY